MEVAGVKGAREGDRCIQIGDIGWCAVGGRWSVGGITEGEIMQGGVGTITKVVEIVS